MCDYISSLLNLLISLICWEVSANSKAFWIVVKHLQFGYVCPKDIVWDVLWYVECNFASLTHAPVFILGVSGTSEGTYVCMCVFVSERANGVCLTCWVAEPWSLWEMVMEGGVHPPHHCLLGAVSLFCVGELCQVPGGSWAPGGLWQDWLPVASAPLRLLPIGLGHPIWGLPPSPVGMGR